MSDEDEDASSSSSSSSSDSSSSDEGGSDVVASNKNASKNLSLLEVALKKNGNGNKNLSLLEVAPERRNSRVAMPMQTASESSGSTSSSEDDSSDDSSDGEEEAKRKDEWKYRRRKKSPPNKNTAKTANTATRMAKANNNSKPSSKTTTTSGRNSDFRRSGDFMSDSSGDDDILAALESSSSPEKDKTAPKRRKSFIRASRFDNSESNLGTRSWNRRVRGDPDSAVLPIEAMAASLAVPLKDEMEDEGQEEDEDSEVKAEGHVGNKSSAERYHTPEQMRIMLDFYRQKHYPSKEDFIALERETGLSPKKLLYWFSNRRRRKNDLAKETPNPRGRRPHQSSSVAKAELLPPLPPTPTPAAVLDDPDDQKFFMVQFFKTNPYPTREEMRQIGERIGLTEKKVFYWFSNRRRKEKPEGFVSRKQQQPKDEEEGLSPERPPRLPKLEVASSPRPDSDSSRTPSPAKRENYSSPPVHHSASSSSEQEGGGESFKAETVLSDTTPDPGDTEEKPEKPEKLKKTSDLKIEVPEGGAIGDAADAPRYSCRLCKYVTETGRGNLLRHFRDTHKMKPKFCKRCKLVYLKNAEFKKHEPCYRAAEAATEVKAEDDEDASDDPEVSFSSPEKGSPEKGSPENGSPQNGSPEKGSPEKGSFSSSVKREQSQQKKPHFHSQRYKNLLDRLGSKSRKNQSVDEVAAGSPFQRNGKLELVMVTRGQFNAVQDFIGGDDTGNRVMRVGGRGCMDAYYSGFARSA